MAGKPTLSKAASKPATDKSESGNTASKVKPIHAFDFLATLPPQPMPAVVVCYGTDDFLRSQAIRHWKANSGIEPECVRSFDADETTWRDVHDELATRSLFDMAGAKLAIVRSADKFLTKYRETLEAWTENPAPDSHLILELQTFQANHTITKLVSKLGPPIQCSAPTKSSWGNPPDDKAIQAWVESWAVKKHQLKLTSKQSSLIVERIGAVCGLIDCELCKLALFAEGGKDSEMKRVSDQRVHELVGGWRTQTAWELADDIADGKVGRSLEQLDKLIFSGQSPVGLMAQLSWALRRYGVAAQLVEQSERVDSKIPLGTALERAGFNRFDLAKSESRLKRIGRVRAKELLAGLVDLELKLKGSHSADDRARHALESLIMKLG
jgi:DNA polymerase III subunit delta